MAAFNNLTYSSTSLRYVMMIQPTLVAKLNSDHLRPLVDCLISCVEDSDVKIRDASAASLAALTPTGKYTLKSAYVHVLYCIYLIMM